MSPSAKASPSGAWVGAVRGLAGRALAEASRGLADGVALGRSVPVVGHLRARRIGDNTGRGGVVDAPAGAGQPARQPLVVRKQRRALGPGRARVLGPVDPLVEVAEERVGQGEPRLVGAAGLLLDQRLEVADRILRAAEELGRVVVVHRQREPRAPVGRVDLERLLEEGVRTPDQGALFHEGGERDAALAQGPGEPDPRLGRVGRALDGGPEDGLGAIGLGLRGGGVLGLGGGDARLEGALALVELLRPHGHGPGREGEQGDGGSFHRFLRFGLEWRSAFVLFQSNPRARFRIRWEARSYKSGGGAGPAAGARHRSRAAAPRERLSESGRDGYLGADPYREEPC